MKMRDDDYYFRVARQMSEENRVLKKKITSLEGEIRRRLQQVNEAWQLYNEELLLNDSLLRELHRRKSADDQEARALLTENTNG